VARLSTIGLVVAAALAVTLFGLSRVRRAQAPVAVSLDALRPIGRVSDRFLSYNIEMTEVTGGRFWRPYGAAGAAKDDERFAYRPALDLTNPRLRMLAHALGPAYVRFSGTWANTTFFSESDTPPQKPPEGFSAVLTKAEWKAAIEFAHAVDAASVVSFATSAGARDASGHWRPDNADKWLRYTQSVGGEIAAAEFANEPNFIALTQAPAGYQAADYRGDYQRFYVWLRSISPRTRILAPGAAELGQPLATITRFFSGMKVLRAGELLASNSPRPDALSFHYYGGSSERCNIAVFGTRERNATSESWLAGIDDAIRSAARLRDRFAPGAPLWITESGESACGGNPWAKTFLDTFRFTDQLARSARQGISVFMHNTLSASDYGLLDETTLLPRPNYWAALLWRRLMGSIVLDARTAAGDLHLYAQCQREVPGGVVVLAINLQKDRPRVLQVGAAGKLFALTEAPSGPAQAALNGKLLSLGPDDTLPELQGIPVGPGPVRLAPASINFLAFDTAHQDSCAAQ
jgi:hypothetical protein